MAPGVFVHAGLHEEFSPANAGGIANLGFVVGGRSVAVVDSGGSRSQGAALLEAVRQRTALPVSHVVNTHRPPRPPVRQPGVRERRGGDRDRARPRRRRAALGHRRRLGALRCGGGRPAGHDRRGVRLGSPAARAPAAGGAQVGAMRAGAAFREVRTGCSSSRPGCGPSLAANALSEALAAIEHLRRRPGSPTASGSASPRRRA